MQIIARYPGKCAATGRPFNAGDLIDYTKKRAVLIAENKSIEIRFASGDTFYRNARGRCEDAPCCGCCTI